MKKLFAILFLNAIFSTALFAQTTVTIPLSVKITKQASNSTIISTVWSFDSGTGGTIANPTQPSTTATLPAGVFKIRITVKDNMGNAPYFIKTVNVVDNRAPIIDAGAADTTIYLGTTSAVLEPKDEGVVLKVIPSDNIGVIYGTAWKNEW